MRLSVSQLNTWSQCQRHWYFTKVLKIPVTQLRSAAQGEAVHKVVEDVMLGRASDAAGAAARILERYPVPGQEGVLVEQEFVFPYAGATLKGKIDLAAVPGTRWARFGVPQKQGLARINDTKTVGNLSGQHVKTAEQLDGDRQLLAYGLALWAGALPLPRYDARLLEVSQTQVERSAPHRAKIAGPRIISRDMAREQEEYDRELVAEMERAVLLPDEGWRDLAPAPIRSCESWFGERCPFYSKCHGGVEEGGTLRSLDDILAAPEADGRGGAGTRRVLEEVARDMQKPRIDSFDGEFGFLSNFYPSRVEAVREIWPTVEHAYQASKCRNPEDVSRFMSTPTASGAKRLGKEVAIRPDWEVIKIPLMKDLLRQKFQHLDLRARLLATGDAELVEGNTWGDVFWGVCRGTGLNHLGRLLMDVRSEIKKEEALMLINPPDANHNHTNRALEIEGPASFRTDVVQGQPFLAVAGERHGQAYELRCLGSLYKFVLGGTLQRGTRPDGSSVTKMTGGTPSDDALVEGAVREDDAKGPAYRHPGYLEEGRINADLLRQHVLHPLLLAWDARVAPPAPPREEPSTDALSTLESAAAAAPVANSGVDEVAKLVSSGCTQYQAEKMVGAGITDARLRAGEVKQAELEALPKFGAAKAADILKRYGAAPVQKEEENSEALRQARMKQLELLEIAEKAIDERSSMQEKVRELEAALAASEQRWKESSSETAAGYVLYLDCFPAKGIATTTLEEVLQPYLCTVAEQRDVPDVLCLKAFEWPGYLMESLYDRTPPADLPIVVRTSAKEWDVVRRYFLDRARIVVQGIR